MLQREADRKNRDNAAWKPPAISSTPPSFLANDDPARSPLNYGLRYGMIRWRGVQMKKLVLFATTLSLAAQLHAQPGSNPLSSATKGMFGSVKNDVLKSAEEMPEENYAFKPTPDVRSFGQLVGHVADAQYEFCSGIVADGTKSPDVEKTKTTKADLIQALKTAFAYCDKAYDGMTDAHAAETIKFFGHELPKLSILDYNTAHTDEHYGNMVTYLRMKGLVPPSSQH